MIKGIIIGVIGVALVVDRVFLTRDLKWEKHKYKCLEKQYNRLGDQFSVLTAQILKERADA